MFGKQKLALHFLPLLEKKNTTVESRGQTLAVHEEHTCQGCHLAMESVSEHVLVLYQIVFQVCFSTILTDSGSH